MSVGFVYEDRGYATPCRIWQGAQRGSGDPYGGRRRNGRLVYVHRDEWEQAFGEIPAGLRVLHHCDQPLCAELSHLFLGTQGDNVADALAKGRHRVPRLRGERNPWARLTAVMVAEIRASSESGASLARRFGVTRSTVADIRHRRTWREAA